MNDVLLFSGTTEGRRLSAALAEQGIPVTVCVATEYGRAKQLEQGDYDTLRILTGRLDTEQMTALLQEASLCVDATHPYAVEVTQNIAAAAEKTGTELLRLVREKSPVPETALTADSAAQAVDLLRDTEGNILLTTGAKELQAFLPLGTERLYLRLLPAPENIRSALDAGLPRGHLIAMEGPFSKEFNAALLHQLDISYLVTKNGGPVGGFPEKAEAAAETDTALVVILPPEEEGLSYGEVLETIRTKFMGRL